MQWLLLDLAHSSVPRSTAISLLDVLAYRPQEHYLRLCRAGRSELRSQIPSGRSLPSHLTMALASTTRTAFASRTVGSGPRIARICTTKQQRSLRVRSQEDWYTETAQAEYEPMYPNSFFIKETLEAFPEKGIANVEEARVSWARHSAM